MDFHTLKRKELQSLCKENGIPANLKNVEMADRLALHFKGKKGKSCLKIVEIDDEKQESKEKKKKVKFSPQNEMFEFERTDPREMRLMGRKRRSIALLKERDNVRDEVNVEGGEGEKKNVRRRKSVVGVGVERENAVSDCEEGGEELEGKKNIGRRPRRKSVVGTQVVAVPCEEKAVEVKKPERFSRRKSVVKPVVEEEETVEVKKPERISRRKAVVKPVEEEETVEVKKPERVSRRKSVVKPVVEDKEVMEVCEDIGFEGKPVGKRCSERGAEQKSRVIVKPTVVSEVTGAEDKPVENQPQRSLRSRARKRHFEDQCNEVMSSPTIGRKAMSSRNRQENVEEGASEVVTKLVDKTNNGSEKPLAVGRTWRQLSRQEVMAVDSTEGDKDGVVEVPEKKKLKKSECVVDAPRKSVNQMKKTKADEGFPLSEGQGNKLVLARSSEDCLVDVVPDKRKSNKEKKTSTVIEKEFFGVIYDAKKDQHVSVEKTDVDVVGKKVRGRKAATKKSRKQTAEVDMDVQNNDLKKQTKTSQKDDSKVVQVARRSTRQAGKNKVDSLVCADVMDDIVLQSSADKEVGEEAASCGKEKTEAVGSTSCNKEIVPSEATPAHGSPDDKEIELKGQYEIPGGSISLEHKVEISERVVQTLSGSSLLLCEINGTIESAGCGIYNVKKPSENLDCDAESSANNGHQCRARRDSDSEGPKAEMVDNLIPVSANSSEDDLMKSEDCEEATQCIKEGTDEAGSDAQNPPNNEVSVNLLMQNDGCGEAKSSGLGNICSGIPLELHGTGTYYSDEETVATPQSIETRESNDKSCSFMAVEHSLGSMDSTNQSKASQNEHSTKCERDVHTSTSGKIEAELTEQQDVAVASASFISELQFTASAAPEFSNLSSFEKTEADLPEQQDVAVASVSNNCELQVIASAAHEFSTLAPLEKTEAEFPEQQDVTVASASYNDDGLQFTASAEPEFFNLASFKKTEAELPEKQDVAVASESNNSELQVTASASPEFSNLASLEKTEAKFPEQQDVVVASASYNELKVTASAAPEISNLAEEAVSEPVTGEPNTLVQSTACPKISSLSETENLKESEETKMTKPEVSKIISSCAEISEAVVGEYTHSSSVIDGSSAVASVATVSCNLIEVSENATITTPLEAQEACVCRSDTGECDSCKLHNDATTETIRSHESSSTPYLQFQADVDREPLGSETELEESFGNMSRGDLAAMSVENVQKEQALACPAAPVEESLEGASCSEIRSPKSSTITSFNVAVENGFTFQSSDLVSVGCEADVLPFTPPRLSSAALDALINRFESPETTKEREFVVRNCHSALNQEVNYEVFKGSFDASSAVANKDITYCTTMNGLSLTHSESGTCLDVSIEKQLSKENALKYDTGKLEFSAETHVDECEEAAKDDTKDLQCGENIDVAEKPSSSAVCFEKGADMPFTALEVNPVEVDGAADSCSSPGSFSSQDIPLSNRFSVLGQRISYEVFGECCFSEAKKDFAYNSSDDKNFLTRQKSGTLTDASNSKQTIDGCSGNISSKVDVNEAEQENPVMKSLEFDLLWGQIFNDVVEESRVEAPASNLSVNDYEGNINDTTILDPQNDILGQVVSSHERLEVKFGDCPHHCDKVEGKQSTAELIPKLSEVQPSEVVKETLEVQNTRAVPEDPVKSFISKEQKYRSILIHGTPQKPPLFTHDMKENALAPKALQMADVTAVKRLGKRKPLENLL